jgi:hypothetical protein
MNLLSEGPKRRGVLLDACEKLGLGLIVALGNKLLECTADVIECRGRWELCRIGDVQKLREGARCEAQLQARCHHTRWITSNVIYGSSARRLQGQSTHISSLLRHITETKVSKSLESSKGKTLTNWISKGWVEVLIRLVVS